MDPTPHEASGPPAPPHSDAVRGEPAPLGKSEPPVIRQIRRPSGTHERIQEAIKSYITRNRLRAGDPIPPEGALARQLDVSRNSVREAVKSLEVLGVLEVRHGRGLFVKDFSFDPLLKNLSYGMLWDLHEVRELLEVRLYLEHGLAARVIESLNDEDLARLQLVLDRMRTLASEGQYSTDHDQEFHRLLYVGIENETLKRLIDVFWFAFNEARARADIPDPENPLETYQRHAEIAEAVKSRDVAQLEEAIRRHYKGISERLEGATVSTRQSQRKQARG